MICRILTKNVKHQIFLLVTSEAVQSILITLPNASNNTTVEGKGYPAKMYSTVGAGVGKSLHMHITRRLQCQH